jgi:hypothetical protein
MPTPLYGTIFYGGGKLYGPSGIDIPVDLRFYRTNTDGVYVFHWGFQFGYISDALATADYQLDICEDPSFTGPTLTSYLSASPGVIQYQNGNIRKGYAISVASRANKVDQPWYARVAVVTGSLTSDFSDTMQFIIPQRWEVEEAENFLNNLPDYHVYGKEDLLKAISARNTNLWVVGDMYGREFDSVKLENLLTTTNNFIDLCRDEQLYNNFGVFFNYVKPQNQVFIEYREVLRTMILGSLTGSTIAAVQSVVVGFAGVPASIELVRDRGDFFLNTNLEIPPESPNGVRTFFSTNFWTTTVTSIVDGITLQVADSTGFLQQYMLNVNSSAQLPILSKPDSTHIQVSSTVGVNPGDVLTQGYPFIKGSMRVLKNGTVLANPANFTEQAFPPGINMVSPPAALDLIQIEYDFGNVGDPVPLVFDIEDKTVLTGTVTFTHNSLAITGVGTLFSTQLLPGDTITDSQGLILGEVATITDNFNLILADPWIGDTGSGTAYKLTYGEF